MIAGMRPVLNPGVFVYTSVAPDTNTGNAGVIAFIREQEGLTLVVPEAQGRALADAGVGCNVVAGAYHDHIFVPVDLAQQAMQALMRLQQSMA